MSGGSSRRRFLALAGSTTIAALAGCSGGDGGGGETEAESMDDGMIGEGSMDGETTETGSMAEDDGMASVTVTVRVENVAPTDAYGAEAPTGGAVWLTPGAFAVHTAENPIFTAGEPASVGLEALAEAGPPTGFAGEPGLLGELQERAGSGGVVTAGAYTPDNTVADPEDPTGEVPGAPPIAPGGTFEFDIGVRPGRLSFASMFVPSNDVFVAPGASGITLWPADGEPVEGDVTDRVELWDAGTEPNAQPPGKGPDQAPAQNGPMQGADEDGVVRRLGDVDDGHAYPAAGDVIRVTLTPHGAMDDGT